MILGLVCLVFKVFVAAVALFMLVFVFAAVKVSAEADRVMEETMRRMEENERDI